LTYICSVSLFIIIAAEFVEGDSHDIDMYDVRDDEPEMELTKFTVLTLS
jgi:hypothetical protein